MPSKSTETDVTSMSLDSATPQHSSFNSQPLCHHFPQQVCQSWSLDTVFLFQTFKHFFSLSCHFLFHFENEQMIGKILDLDAWLVQQIDKHKRKTESQRQACPSIIADSCCIISGFCCCQPCQRTCTDKLTTWSAFKFLLTNFSMRWTGTCRAVLVARWHLLNEYRNSVV